MASTLHDRWHVNDEHRRTNQDDKHLKAFVGIVLFIVVGFVLAGLHPAARTDSPDMQTSGHAMIRPAN